MSLIGLMHMTYNVHREYTWQTAKICIGRKHAACENDREDFGALWVWGFRGDSHRLFRWVWDGYHMGIEIQSNLHGSPEIWWSEDVLNHNRAAARGKFSVRQFWPWILTLNCDLDFSKVNDNIWRRCRTYLQNFLNIGLTSVLPGCHVNKWTS